MSEKKKPTNARIFLNSIPDNAEKPDIMREREGGLISVGDGVLFDWQKAVYGGVIMLSVVIKEEKIIYAFNFNKKSSYGTINFSGTSIDIIIRMLNEYFE